MVEEDRERSTEGVSVIEVDRRCKKRRERQMIEKQEREREEEGVKYRKLTIANKVKNMQNNANGK